ncbi:MAG: RnfABCDGE type electron transport complex subunit G [Limnochordia bacterium]|jgi:electron transport complex protein RnfG
MAKYVQMIVVLTCIALMAGAVLPFAYNAANIKIAENRDAAMRDTIMAVLPGAVRVETIVSESPTVVEEDDITLAEEPPTQQRIPLYRGLDGAGNEVGLAFIAEKPGYGGRIRVMVGIDPAAMKVHRIEILEQKETPGLGSRIADAEFKNQFTGKSLNDPFVVGRDIQGISGATVSSEAVVDAVRETSQRVLEQER